LLFIFHIFMMMPSLLSRHDFITAATLRFLHYISFRFFTIALPFRRLPYFIFPPLQVGLFSFSSQFR